MDEVYHFQSYASEVVKPRLKSSLKMGGWMLGGQETLFYWVPDSLLTTDYQPARSYLCTVHLHASIYNVVTYYPTHLPGGPLLCRIGNLLSYLPTQRFPKIETYHQLKCGLIYNWAITTSLGFIYNWVIMNFQCRCTGVSSIWPARTCIKDNFLHLESTCLTLG